MKILMVLESSFPPDLRVENEIDTLAEAGHEVHLACWERGEKTKNHAYPGVTIHRRAIPKTIYQSSVGALRTPFYFNWWKKYLHSLLSEIKFDVVHVHDLRLASVAIKLKKEFKFKVVLDLHENYPELLNISDHIKRFPANVMFDLAEWQDYEIEAVMGADKVIVVVEEAKDRLIKLGCKKEKISIVSNTFPDYKFPVPNHADKNKEFTIFYGGGITRHRGLQYVMNALSLVTQEFKTVRFEIFGKGKFEEELKELCESLNLSEHVSFRGWIPPEEMLEYLSKAQVAIIPHIKSPHTDSTIPHKLFQYMAYGIPVITSDCSPLARVVATENCGLVYHHDKPGELADCIIDLMRQPIIANMMGEKGKRAVSEKYLWRYDAEILIELYGEL